jgi:hypothetical protein
MAHWFLVRGGSEDGPITTQRLKAMAAAGEIGPLDLIRRDDMKAPTTAGRVKGLFTSEHGIQPRPSPRPAQPLAAIPVLDALPISGPKPPEAIPVRAAAAVPAAVPVVAATKSGPAPEAPVQKVSWYKRRWVRGGVAVLVFLFLLGRLIVRVAGPSTPGTITFAEYVDDKTLKTTHAGTRFTTGWVYVVVRGRKRFGDSTLIVYGREHGSELWNVVGQIVVDPNWDMAVGREMLDEAGKLDIKVTTSRGVLVAQSTVEIVGR